MSAGKVYKAGAPSFSIIGAGKVGKTISYLLVRRGYKLDYVVNRSLSSAKRAVRFIAEGTALPSPDMRLAESDFIFIGVPDAEVSSVSDMLSRSGVVRSGQQLVMFSGILCHNELRVRQEIGTASIHFVHSFADPRVSVSCFNRVFAVYDCDNRSKAIVLRIIKSLRARPVRIRPSDKARYHAGCVFVSNFLVTLSNVASTLFSRCGISDRDAEKIICSLAGSAITNIAIKGSVDSLTGPVERGDCDVVKRHLRVLPREHKALYSTLTRLTVEVARRKGTPAGKLEKIMNVLARS